MSILTSRMSVNRSSMNPGACVLYLPFDEGSGNVFSDVIGDAVVTDNGTATHEANGATFVNTGSLTSGSFPALPAGKSLIVLDVMRAGSAGGFGVANQIGVTAEQAYGMTNSAFVKASGQTASSADFMTITNNSLYVFVNTFDGKTGTLSAYSGEDGVASKLDNTTDASVHIGGITPSAANWGLGGTAVDDVEVFGAAVYMVNTLPSPATILEAADWTYTNWTNGVKGLPPQFADLT